MWNPPGAIPITDSCTRSKRHIGELAKEKVGGGGGDGEEGKRAALTRKEKESKRKKSKVGLVRGKSSLTHVRHLGGVGWSLPNAA
jgi:hypothetical protein